LFYQQNMFRPLLILVLILGLGAYASLGTLLAALSIQTRTRDVLLPVLIYPLALPILIAAVESTRSILAGLLLADYQSWLYFLLGCNILFSAAGLLFFETILEE
jgi:heme exporter protein B